MAAVNIPLRWLPHGEGLPLPAPQTPGAAGLDLQAAIATGDILTLLPGERALVPCGFAMALPSGFEAQIRPRSGLALRHGVTVLNAPGTVDADYRGEICVLLVNLGSEPFPVRRGERIAQMVVAPVNDVQLVIAGELDDTARGGKGFGSTGQSTPPA